MTELKSFKTYENCCRTCLNEQTNFDIFMDTLNSTIIADILMSCTTLSVQKEDYLPNKMCGCCYNCLKGFYRFRELAKNVDTKLRETIQSNGNITCYNGFELEGSKLIEVKVEYDMQNDFEASNSEQNLQLDENKNLDIDTNNQQGLIKIDRTEKKEKIKCKFCSKTFRKRSRLQVHVQKHKINEDFDSIISKVTNNDNSVIHTDCNTDSFPCSMCNKKFTSSNSLSAHMRKHTEKGRILACSVCGKVFKKVSHLKRHEAIHDKSCYYKCSLCPRLFQSEAILKSHMNKHNGIKPHACPLCPKAFSYLSTLASHVKMHNRDKLLCPVCGKRFDSSTNLNQHVKRHLGLKKFECTLCPKKFVSKGELNSHIVTHTRERSHTCDQCGDSFTKQSSLHKHKLRHLGIKPYQCDTCSMKFYNKDHLKRHIRIHTGEKPYKCDMCERAYIQSNDLVKHRRAHLGEKIYKCTDCSESFRLQRELREHISQHFVSSRLKKEQMENAT